MKVLVTDALWQRVEPLLPPPPRRRFRFAGRKPLDYRKILTGILFVLKTGIAWNDLPRELGCGSGSRCRRRLAEWQEQGVWVRLHALLLAELREADQIDWARAAVDSASVRALGGGEKTGPNPTDRGKKGSKHHAVVDRHSIPLAATVTAANVPDVTEVLEVVDAIPDVRGKPYVFAKGILQDAGFAWRVEGDVQGYAPNSVVAHEALGTVRFLAGDARAAIEPALESLRRQPKSALHWLRLAAFYAAAGDKAKASEILEQWGSARGAYEEFFAASALSGLGRDEEALQKLKSWKLAMERRREHFGPFRLWFRNDPNFSRLRQAREPDCCFPPVDVKSG